MFCLWGTWNQILCRQLILMGTSFLSINRCSLPLCSTLTVPVSLLYGTGTLASLSYILEPILFYMGTYNMEQGSAILTCLLKLVFFFFVLTAYLTTIVIPADGGGGFLVSLPAIRSTSRYLHCLGMMPLYICRTCYRYRWNFYFRLPNSLPLPGLSLRIPYFLYF